MSLVDGMAADRMGYVPTALIQHEPKRSKDQNTNGLKRITSVVEYLAYEQFLTKVGG